MLVTCSGSADTFPSAYIEVLICLDGKVAFANSFSPPKTSKGSVQLCLFPRKPCQMGQYQQVSRCQISDGWLCFNAHLLSKLDLKALKYGQAELVCKNVQV